MKKLELADKWVLVTGASSGLGQEMARQLATKYKANLIIAARRADKLDELKARTGGISRDAGKSDSCRPLRTRGCRCGD
jgi:short-subunit dehydrogenase